MANGLILEARGNRPHNLHLRPDQLNYHLDGDTRAWLKNLPLEVEGGEHMFVVIHEGAQSPFVVMEACTDGIDRFVLRSKKLGAHEYHLLRRARFIPLSKRLDAFEKEEAAHDLAQKEEEQAKLYEEIGGPMYRMLHRYGFAHGRSESYAKAGPKMQRARAGRPKTSPAPGGGVLLERR